MSCNGALQQDALPALRREVPAPRVVIALPGGSHARAPLVFWLCPTPRVKAVANGALQASHGRLGIAQRAEVA